MLARVIAIAFVGAVFVFGALGACDKPSHENIDKWTHTEHGKAKLVEAIDDDHLDPELAAHAAANLLRMGDTGDVTTAFGRMDPGRRGAIVGKIAARMWDAARVDGDMTIPRTEQVQAKDSLVMLRKQADDATRAQIDAYLIDWYCVRSYERRAAAGAVLGATVVRMIGPAAGKKLEPIVDAIITAPASGANASKHERVGDELLVALAASGSPEAAKYLVDLAKMKGPDQTLPQRALEALYKAYVDPAGEFDVQAPAALVPNLPGLIAIARDPDAGDAAAYAIKLVRTIGPPACVDPLVQLVSYPHPNANFKLVAADSALKCGGIPAIEPVVHALPDVAYSRDQLFGAVASITKMTPPAKAEEVVRGLLADKGRIPRWVAIEVLAAMKSTADAPALAAVSSSEKLTGFWGDQSGVDPKDRKPDPTLGQRAKELAATLK
jgi:hypothetical protein